MTLTRDHGGGLDSAIAKYGGTRSDWLDLSTGINPAPYPLPQFAPDTWTALPDKDSFDRLYGLARSFWRVPEKAGVIAAAGASPLIAAIPRLVTAESVNIPGPTYNEHCAAFEAAGWELTERPAEAVVAVHPNNPDGHLWKAERLSAPLTIIDESFCDLHPEKSLISLSERPGTLVIKSFGKFWGLGGVRLGFAIGDPVLIDKLGEILGPWQVSGPALMIGSEALADPQWADTTRAQLEPQAQKLDSLLHSKGADLVGGTNLFRLYKVKNAKAAQDRLAKSYVWSRVFPYSESWLRLGLPPTDRWDQLERAL